MVFLRDQVGRREPAHLLIQVMNYTRRIVEVSRLGPTCVAAPEVLLMQLVVDH